MIVLYINSEHCTSLEQLKRYFSMSLTPESDIYVDLLDYGRHGDISKWLREKDEADIASSVDAIDTSLSDSAFYAKLKAAITGIADNTGPLKPAFDKCFCFEELKYDVRDNDAKVTVILKVMMCVNEDYELSVSSNWGTRAELVNPYNYPEGKTASFTFTLRKRPRKDVGEIKVMGDGKVLSTSNKSSDTSDEILVGKVKFKMIHVEGGTFTMGATSEQGSDADSDEKPTHSVTLSSYYIGETPVTQELWEAVMGNNPSDSKGAQRPVENVSWVDCQDFIRCLNQRTGKNFRLPTEAEWEYAARGGRKSNGSKYAGGSSVDDVAWYTNNSDSETHPVAQKRANELGLYDMSGNVWEWCQDWYDSDYYKKSPTRDLKGPTSGSSRVARGGCWHNGAWDCRVSCRNYNSPDFRYCGLGLRLALSELRTSA